jgi:hypothetical protein
MVPSAATPRLPPICRHVLGIAEAAALWRAATVETAALLTGQIIRPTPMPARAKLASTPASGPADWQQSQ